MDYGNEKLQHPSTYAFEIATKGLNYYRIVCDKHEYVQVTQTTTNNSPTNPVNETKHWMQCKKCGHTPTEQRLS